MTELDRGWEDVLRRAQRLRVTPRLAAVAVAVIAVAAAAPALGVLLTRPSPPHLPIDEIGGTTLTSVIDPRTHETLLEYGRWKGHDGVCYLVPYVQAGCLRTGQTGPPFEERSRFIPMPLLHRARTQGQRLVFLTRRDVRVLALPGGNAELVKSR